MELVEMAGSFSGIYLREYSQAELLPCGVESRVVLDLTLGALQPVARLREGLLVNGSFYEEHTQGSWHFYRDSNGTLQYLSIQGKPQIQRGKGSARYFWRICLRVLRARHKASRVDNFRRDLPTRQIKVMRRRHSLSISTQFLERLATSRGVIIRRFHCVTFCLLSRTPFFAIASNTHKIEGLLDKCGLSGRIFNEYALALAAAQEIDFSEEEKRAVSRSVADSAALGRLILSR